MSRLDCNEIVLRDSRGRPRIYLGMDRDDKPLIAVADENLRARITLRIDEADDGEEVPCACVMDGDGEVLVYVGTDRLVRPAPNGEGGIFLGETSLIEIFPGNICED